MQTVQLELTEPVTVTLAPPQIRHWGPYQFPGLERLPDGSIRVGFQVGADSATAVGLPPMQAVSSDEGRSWAVLPLAQDATGAVSCTQPPLRLSNGERIQIKMLPALPASMVSLPATPAGAFTCYGHARTFYRPEHLSPEARDGWHLYRFAGDDAPPLEERATMRLPGELRVVTEGVLPRPWGTGHRLLRAPDDTVWAIGNDCRMVDRQFREKMAVTILRSTDHRHLFDYWAEIPYEPDPAADPQAAVRAGFTEPCIHFMPDGSVFCLLRTTDGNGVDPLYWARSTDNGRTWTKPAVFEELGVWPQMLTLKNGVTLATYGRPGLHVRATSDPSGLAWDARVAVVPPGDYQKDTCSYSALLPLSDDTALIAYSEFNLPDPDGRPCKGIRVRRISATGLAGYLNH